jgi:type IV secretion system protein VirB1
VSTYLASLVLACAPQVQASTAQALVTVESGRNPYAIGVVGAALDRQPRSRAEAVATARKLRADGWNFSAGLAQINVRNWAALGLDETQAFEPCANLRAMQTILARCYGNAAKVARGEQARLRHALSCYYAGDWETGIRQGYVDRVLAAARPGQAGQRRSMAAGKVF